MRDVSNPVDNMAPQEWDEIKAAQLIGADLAGKRFNKVKLPLLNLSYSSIGSANLEDKTLIGAIFSYSSMLGTNLKGALVTNASFYDVEFQPSELPNVESMATAKGLSSLTWRNNASKIFALRDGLKLTDRRGAAREVNYAIRHTERVRSDAFTSVFELIFFEFGSAWGLRPYRLPLILLFMALYTALIYGLAARWFEDQLLKCPPNKLKEYGGYVALRGSMWKSYKIGLLTSAASILSIVNILNPFKLIVRDPAHKAALEVTALIRFQAVLSAILITMTVLVLINNELFF
jgi:hypothetical protein